MPIKRKVYKLLSGLGLRTKFLCSLVLITSGLTGITVLVVGRVAKNQAEREIAADARSAILTFQVIERQHRASLAHKADLLATLAMLRNGDATTVRDASEDPWQDQDTNFFLLADAHEHIIALQTTLGEFPAPAAEKFLRRMLRLRESSGWWYGGARLYQVVLRPVFGGPKMNQRIGTVVVGREIDAEIANELHRISSSEIAFRRGSEVIVSTLEPLEEEYLLEQMRTQQPGGAHVPVTVPAAPIEAQAISGRQAGSSARARRRIADEAFAQFLTNAPVSSGTPVSLGGEKYLASTLELTPATENDPGITLVILKSYSNATAFIGRLNRLLTGLLILAVLAGSALVYFIAHTFTKPLAALAGGVRALEEGNYSYQLKARGYDEAAQLTRAFHRMRSALQRDERQRKNLEAQLWQSQRMEAMGRLAGGVAHDFNNLLTVIKGHSDLLLGKLSSADPLRSSGEQIAKAADRAASLTRQLLIFSRKQVPRPETVDLNATVSEMNKMLQRIIREDVDFSFGAGEGLWRVKADPSQVEQVMMNLVVNACDAMPSGGKLTVETFNCIADDAYAAEHSPLPSGCYTVLAVTDTGCGMDAETQAHIFEPFFTTKPEGKGTGLGLATVYGVMKQSNGFVHVSSAPGEGARFEIYFPRAEGVAQPAMADIRAISSKRRPETILIVEDQAELREVASEFADSLGYKVLTAADGAEALRILRRYKREVDVMLADVVMPKMSGVELGRRAREISPKLHIIYMSGYLEYQKEGESLLGDAPFLQKPFTREALARTIEEALNKLACDSEASLPALVR